MYLRFSTCFAFLTNLVLVIGVVFSSQQAAIATGTEFSCESDTTRNGVTVPATIAQTESGEKISIILWVSNYFNAVGGTPEVRCKEVSRRFQRYYDNDLLKYIRTGIFNNLSVLCVARSATSECRESDIIFTLPPGIDRFSALAQLLDLNRIASGRPLYLTDDLIIYRNGEAFINIEILMERVANPSSTL